MQDKPNLIPSETTETEPIQPTRRQRTSRWFARRRRTIAFHFVRGVAYGAGAGGVGFVLWWIENH